MPGYETGFPREEDQITSSLGTSTAGPAYTMNIDIGRGWDTDLDDSCDSWVIDASSRDVAGN